MFARTPLSATAALAALILGACDPRVTDPPGPLPPPVSLEWQHSARALVAQKSMSPLAAARLFAASSMAAWRAAEEAKAELGNGQGGRAAYEARRGAVAGASAKVLAWFAPDLAADYEAMVTAQGEAGPGGTHPAYTQGVELGRAAAADVIAHVSTDRFTAPWTGSIPVGPGLWTTTTLPPAGVSLVNAKPWVLTSNSQFRPTPPPAYLSAAFNADLAETAAIAASRTQQQRDIALAWAYGGGTFTPTGYWNELASKYVADAGMEEAAAAKVFALLGAAQFDAFIACFEAKYHYWTLRPHQANNAITTVFAVPNYPAYPSGHGSVSGASARVLAHFFPSRTAELNAKVTEAAESRLYAGIHYRFDMTAARSMAEAVADWVIAHAQ